MKTPREREAARQGGHATNETDGKGYGNVTDSQIVDFIRAPSLATFLGAFPYFKICSTPEQNQTRTEPQT